MATPQPMLSPNMNIPQRYSGTARTRFFPPPALPDAMGENNTHTAING